MTLYTIPQFVPKTAPEEFLLVTSDDSDYSQTKAYLLPLIRQALKEHGGDSIEAFEELLLSDVPVAARRFATNHQQSPGYKFSTYFSWYISQRLT